MIDVIDFKKEHMDTLWGDQPDYLLYLKDIINPAAWDRHEKSGVAKTCVSKADGRILLCGGFSFHYATRAEAWTFFAKNITRELLFLQRAVKRHVDSVNIPRIESVIYWDQGKEQACRWIESLGFELEVPRLQKFAPDGNDASLYVRIK